MRICSGPGCLRAVADGQRFCDDCKPALQQADDIRTHTLSDRERYSSAYTGPRWQKIRVQVIHACPMCARCGLCISEIVDHIVPSGEAVRQARESGLYRTDAMAGFYFRSNLEGLCRKCHGIKTIEDKTHVGPWPDVVAKERAAPRKAYRF